LIPAGTGLAYRRARKVREQFERDRAQMIAAEEEAMANMPEVEAEAAAPAGEADQA
jgi:DNA-directed RNA polymerase subunit beta'